VPAVIEVGYTNGCNLVSLAENWWHIIASCSESIWIPSKSTKWPLPPCLARNKGTRRLGKNDRKEDEDAGLQHVLHSLLDQLIWMPA
jgi:hypothetical protein